MTKNEFLQKIKNEKIDTGEFLIVLDKITDAPLVMGCAKENEVWKIYQTGERYGHYIIKEFIDENPAFDYFYDLVYGLHKRLAENK